MKNTPRVVNVDLNTCPTEKCVCGSQYFVTRTILKRVNKFTAGTQKDNIIPVDFFVCASCNKVHNDSAPLSIPEQFDKEAG